jgi:hypothetical protein
MKDNFSSGDIFRNGHNLHLRLQPAMVDRGVVLRAPLLDKADRRTAAINISKARGL